MNCWRRITIIIAILFSSAAYAANPFLNAPGDQPISAKFLGTEWSDDIGAEDIPLTARVVTTHIAKMPWGAMADGFRLKRMMLKTQ